MGDKSRNKSTGTRVGGGVVKRKLNSPVPMQSKAAAADIRDEWNRRFEKALAEPSVYAKCLGHGSTGLMGKSFNDIRFRAEKASDKEINKEINILMRKMSSPAASFGGCRELISQLLFNHDGSDAERLREDFSQVMADPALKRSLLERLRRLATRATARQQTTSLKTDEEKEIADFLDSISASHSIGELAEMVNGATISELMGEPHGALKMELLSAVLEKITPYNANGELNDKHLSFEHIGLEQQNKIPGDILARVVDDENNTVIPVELKLKTTDASDSISSLGFANYSIGAIDLDDSWWSDDANYLVLRDRLLANPKLQKQFLELEELLKNDKSVRSVVRERIQKKITDFKVRAEYLDMLDKVSAEGQITPDRYKLLAAIVRHGDLRETTHRQLSDDINALMKNEILGAEKTSITKLKKELSKRPAAELRENLIKELVFRDMGLNQQANKTLYERLRKMPFKEFRGFFQGGLDEQKQKEPAGNYTLGQYGEYYHNRLRAVTRRNDSVDIQSVGREVRQLLSSIDSYDVKIDDFSADAQSAGFFIRLVEKKNPDHVVISNKYSLTNRASATRAGQIRVQQEVRDLG